MAKDGTNRGGPRPGTGPKKKPLIDKINDGGADGEKILPQPAEIEGYDIPPVKDYLKAKQKSGKDLCAEDIFVATYKWLKNCGCEKLVTVQQIEQYAMSVSRWIQCEEAISEFGFLAKHPTTGNAIASPFVAMSRDYMKQVNATWFAIHQIVKENCSVDYGGFTPHDDLMERLLTARRGNQ